ncbi:hypothetical protein WJX73_010079 [Symbiochloris irregularis]|uniref:Uncharacterized protein n=1 Tax=Symbiochloris irregularis TaxID=706552 RepID=A0AAW1P6Y4_9CHLO
MRASTGVLNSGLQRRHTCYRVHYRLPSVTHSRTALQYSARCASSREKEREVKPAYNKYRTTKDIEQDRIKQWKEVTVRDTAAVKPVTFLSSLLFIPAWIKYEATPLPLRFLFQCLWRSLLARIQIWRRQAILQGARLDSALLMGASETDSPPPSFSRQRVIQRWHNSINWLDDARYRVKLLQAYWQGRRQAKAAAPQQAPSAGSA